jgi:uncharacterized protein YkwD
VCLLAISAGCVQYTPPTETAELTRSPSAKERIDQSAETPSQPVTPSGKYDVDVVALERTIHEEMNERRQSNNVSKIPHSSKLSEIGRYKSWHMAKHDYFAHENKPNVSHSQFRLNYESRCPTSGQNLHRLRYNQEVVDVQSELDKTDEVAKLVVNSLMNSPGHRENILDPAYDVEGIGVFVDENGSVFVTQEFCGY